MQKVQRTATMAAPERRGKGMREKEGGKVWGRWRRREEESYPMQLQQWIRVDSTYARSLLRTRII